MLPHSPWRYLPSGRRYSVRAAPAWGSDEVWTDNQAAVDQSWQRHLLQLGYADRVLGGSSRGCARPGSTTARSSS